jgi:hypothetical protein
MRFGFTNVHVIFQHFINDIFRECLDDFMVCYINEIFIFSKNMKDHELVLEKLQEVGFYGKLEQCEFHQSKVEFLGYIISRDGIHMDVCKVQTIVDWATLVFIRDVQCFFGFANFY